MRRRRTLAALLCLLLALLSPFGAAAEENTWQTLCTQYGLEGTDVIAWLEIPGYPLCQPVMQHPTDDAFYARHAPDGSENAYGAVYVQAKYNASDFSDPVTLLYGSSATEDAPFGRLQEQYSGSFDDCRIPRTGLSLKLDDRQAHLSFSPVDSSGGSKSSSVSHCSFLEISSKTE